MFLTIMQFIVDNLILVTVSEIKFILERFKSNKLYVKLFPGLNISEIFLGYLYFISTHHQKL